LDDIPRTSNPSVNFSSRAMRSAITISTNRKSTSFTHTLTYKFGKASGTIATNVGASYSWTIPMSLANQIPNSTSGTCTITCVTYSGSTRVGSSSVTFKATVPSSVVPSIGSIGHNEYYQLYRDFMGSTTGPYIQGLSRVNLSINNASGAYGSSIRSYKITFNGKTYNSRTATSSTVTSSGTLTITGTVTDSRGRSASKSATVNVLAYSPPEVRTFEVTRLNPDGTPNDMGVGAKVTWGGSFTSLDNRNTLTVTVKTKPRGSSTWTTVHSYNAGNTGSVPTQSQIFSSYSELLSHDFRVEFKDAFNTTISLNILPTGLVTMSWGKAGIGVGKA